MNAVDKIKQFEKFGWVLGLERMSVLMDLLGNPQNSMKYIHVAGTNGKGSVSRFIYEVLEANGYRCGLFTSPYVEEFNERIQFHGENISDTQLERITEVVLDATEKMVDKGYESPTEFEVITAEALLYFAMKNADFVVLEVGLGGRGDSTNIIEKSLCSIITSISYDHMDRLGNTLEEIAMEKAGIIKEGCPVVMNVKDISAKKVIARKAYQSGCRLYDVSDVKPYENVMTLEGSRVTADILGTYYSDVKISMTGEFQVENLITALTAIEILRRKEIIKIEKEKLDEGLSRAKQIGRCEVISDNPSIILDGAHNPAGAEALMKTITRYFDQKRVLCVTGILADKDTEGILDSFCNMAGSFIATEPDSERKLSADALSEKISDRGKKVEAISDIKKAYHRAMEQKDDFDAVVFAGSFYLIGKIRRLAGEK